MNLPKGWPTEEMLAAGREATRNEGFWNGAIGNSDLESIFVRMLEAAPPTKEDEPDAWRFWDTKWGEYSYDETPNPHRQCEPLYTRPQSDELRKAAEEACVAIEAQEGPIRGDLFTAWKSLRGELDKAK